MTQTTFNPSDITAHITLSGGNLIATQNAVSTTEAVRAVDGKTTGKYYIEFTIGGTWAGGNSGVGIASISATLAGLLPSAALGSIYFKGGTVYVNTVSQGALTAQAAANVVGVAVDLDANLIWFRIGAGNWNGNAAYSPATGIGGYSTASVTTNGLLTFPAVTLGSNGDTVTANFGATAYANTAPTGFGTWDTNVSAPATNALFSQAGAEPWLNNSGQVNFSQVGIETWYQANTTSTTQARFSQVGAEAWYLVGTVAQFSQVGIEVWRSLANAPPPPAKGGFNMPMLGM